MNQKFSNKKKAEGRVGRDDYSLRQHYLDQLEFLPGVKHLLELATLRDDGYTPAVQSASDYSYSATNYAGNHYRLVGDASGMQHFGWMLKLSNELYSSIHWPVLQLGVRFSNQSFQMKT